MKADAAWDAICIGAGITSLAFAAHVLSRKKDARILVIDKHSVPGGYASIFRRPKASGVFDCSLHKLSGTGEGGNLKRMFESLGLDHELELKVPPTWFEACLPDAHLSLANDPSRVEQALCERYVEEAPAIRKFFEEVNTFGRHGYYQFQMMEGTYEADFAEIRWAHRHLKNISVSEALSARFSDGWLKEILASTGIYVGGYPEDLGYLYFLHVVYATLCRGNAYVRGASQKLSNVLAQRITDAGGEVVLGETVQRILTDEAGKAIGVETNRGRFRSDRVYVNASPHYAMSHFFEATDEIRAVRERLQALKPSRSTTTLYITTDAEPASLGLTACETMIFAAPANAALTARRAAAASPHDDAICERAYWSSSPMEVTNYHKLDPDGGMVVCLNVLDSIAHWPDRWSSGYKAKKARARDALLARLIAAKPAFAKHVVHQEIASPRTYERFTNNTDGAGYGAMVGTDISGHMFHRAFPIEGVHFLSAWVAGPSYEAAFGYAEMKAKQWTT